MLGADSARQISRAYLGRREYVLLTPRFAMRNASLSLCLLLQACNDTARHEIEIRQGSLFFIAVLWANQSKKVKSRE